MRIGMILDKTFPPDPRVENEAVSLIKQGHEVFLFSLKYSDELEEEEIRGIKVKRYKSNRLIYKLSALAFTFPFYRWILSHKIAHFLKKCKIEVIHIHDMQIATSVFMANKNKNLKVILDLHENRPEIMRFYPHLQKFPGNILISPEKWKKNENLLIDKSDYVIVVTEEAKKEIAGRKNFQNSKLVVVPNTVYKNYQSKAVLENEIISNYAKSYIILYLGDTGLRRGLLTAIKSMAVLKKSIVNLKLVIVGSSTSDVVLKEYIREHELENYVDLEGWKDMDLFPSYIEASSICISPLYRNIHHDTTYANKLFQYMSFGKPVLVSDATAQKNLIERTNSGLVHQEKDFVDFADKVLKLYRDPKWSKQLGINGQDFVNSEFHWEKTSWQLTDLYRELDP